MFPAPSEQLIELIGDVFRLIPAELIPDTPEPMALAKVIGSFEPQDVVAVLGQDCRGLADLIVHRRNRNYMEKTFGQLMLQFAESLLVRAQMSIQIWPLTFEAVWLGLINEPNPDNIRAGFTDDRVSLKARQIQAIVILALEMPGHHAIIETATKLLELPKTEQ